MGKRKEKGSEDKGKNTSVNIHDQFFRYTLSKPKTLKSFIKGFFPEIYKDIDFATLKKIPDTYTDKKLRQYFSDLVFSAKLNDGTNVKLTFLLEHKSYIDNTVQRQVNQYILNLWNAETKNKDVLSVPLPIVIYTGQKHWHPKTIRDFFRQKGVSEKYLKYVPDYDILFVSVRDLSDEDIKRLSDDAMLYFWLLLSKYIYDNPQNLIEALRLSANFIKDLFSSQDLYEALEVSLHYISFFHKFAEEEVKTELMEIFTQIEPLPNSLYMDLITKGKELGIKEGKELGIKEGKELGIKEGKELGIKEGKEVGLKIGQYYSKLDMAWRMYKKGFEMQLIIEITGLSEKEILEYIGKQEKNKG